MPANAAESPAESLARAEALIRGGDLAGAEKILMELRRNGSDAAKVRYQLGYVYYRQRRMDEAAAEFQAVRQLAPPGLYSSYFLGRIALFRSHPQEAVTWLEPAARAEPPILDARAQLAKAYADSGLLDSAVEAFQAAIRQAPWDGALHYQLARVYQRLGRAALARDEFAVSERLKTADAQSVEKLTRLSQHVARGEKGPAVRIYEELLGDTRADPDLLVALGVLLAGAGLEREAAEPFRLAAERRPDLFPAQFNQGLTLLKLGKPADAETCLLRAVRLLPESIDANSALALAYLDLGRYADAVAPLEAAWRLRPGDMRLAGLLASAYLRSGSAAKAVAVLQDAVARTPADPKLHLLLIEALQANRDDVQSLAAARNAVRLFPRNAPAHLFLAQQLARMGRYQEAGPVFQKTSELEPGNLDAKLGMAEVLQKKGDAEGSLAVYREALALDARNLPAQLGSARDLILLKRFAEAREVLEAAAAQHPENAALHLELARVYTRLGDQARAADQTALFRQLHAKEPQ